jgi:DNA-binding NarL/FixJ family response regulator
MATALPERVGDAIAVATREHRRMRTNLAELDDARRALASAIQRRHRASRMVVSRRRPDALPAVVDGNPLTPRQLDILRRIAAGRSTDAIAHECWLTRTTVRNHVAAILRRLDAHSRVEAVARARELGLI